jgi:parallel beta-helix repeat protein
MLNTGRGIDLSESFSNTVTDNIIMNNHYGIYLEYSVRNIIKSNNIKSNDYGIYLENSFRNIIKSNNIKSNEYGIPLVGYFVYGNLILKNNFLDNEKDAYFITLLATFRTNRWRQNYWNESRILPKLIYGEKIIVINNSYYYNDFLEIPWFPQIDWHPALKPYNIEGVI